MGALRRRWWLVLACVALVFGAPMVVLATREPTYRAEGTLRAGANLVLSGVIDAEDAARSPTLLDAVRQLLGSPAFVRQVAGDADLRDRFSVSAPAPALVRVRFEGTDAEQARRVVGATLEGVLVERRREAAAEARAGVLVLQREIGQLERAGAPAAALDEAWRRLGEAQVLANTIRSQAGGERIAGPPATPGADRGNLLLVGSVLAVVALASAIGLVVWAERRDETVRGGDDVVDATGLPVLAVVENS